MGREESIFQTGCEISFGLNVVRALGFFFFFLMLVIPTTFQLIRGAILAVLLGAATILALRRGFRLNSWIAGLTLACVTVSTVFMAWGAVNNAPGALRVGTVFAGWPLIYVYIIGVMYKPEDWEPYLKVLGFGTLTVAAMFLVLVAESVGAIDLGVTNLFYSSDVPFGFYEGYVQLNLLNLPTLLFTVPFFIGKITNFGIGFAGKGRTGGWETVALLAGLIMLVVSGKRAFWVIVVMSPFVSMALAWSYGGRVPIARIVLPVLVGVAALGTVYMFYELNLAAIWDDFVTGFSFSGTDVTINAYRRKEQFLALMQGWESNPLFGAGHGGAAADKFGAPVEAWAYELWYVALLFQVGIVGMLVYLTAVFWLCYRSVLLMRIDPSTRPVMVPLLTGMIAFLIANATNPYLSKFDYLWVIFLPAAFLNSYLIRDRESIQGA